MILDDHVRAFLAKEAGLDPERIESYSFEVSEGHAYSEYTIEDFSCFVTLHLTGGLVENEIRRIYLDERDVVEMLNGWQP